MDTIHPLFYLHVVVYIFNLMGKQGNVYLLNLIVLSHSAFINYLRDLGRQTDLYLNLCTI